MSILPVLGICKIGSPSIDLDGGQGWKMVFFWWLFSLLPSMIFESSFYCLLAF
jgi:hypothetical protein